MRIQDLSAVTVQEWAAVVSRCVQLGDCDVDRLPTGRELAARFALSWKRGHEIALRHAFMAGQFQRQMCAERGVMA